MDSPLHQAALNEDFVETLLDQPDNAEMTILAAIRSWLRPRCDARFGQFSWDEILRNARLRPDGVEHFDLMMRGLATVSMRPPDKRCQRATEFGADEAALLQTIALLQLTGSRAAIRLLGEWLPQPAVSSVVKIIRWLAIDLLGAGLEVRVRDRQVTYMQ